MRAKGQISAVSHGNSPRLESWKEIAAFFGRDVRTVRRWEADRQLPVHRVPGGGRGRIFAYAGELEEWLNSSQEILAEPADGDSAAIEDERGSVYPSGIEATSQSVEDTPPGKATIVTLPGGLRREHLPAYAAAFLILMVAGSLLYVRHSGFRTRAAAAVRPESAEASELYLRGRYFWNRRTQPDLDQAVDLFTQAIVHDPHYAPAYAGLSDSYLMLREYGHMADSEAFPRALAAAREAISLDNSSPEAHRSLAFVLCYWVWDMPAADREFRRAIELRPDDSQTHHWYATALLASGRGDDALRQIDLARSLEPHSISVLADRALILNLRDPHSSINALQQLERSDPGFDSTHVYLAAGYLATGDFAGYLTESHRVAELAHDAEGQRVIERAQAALATDGAHAMLLGLGSELAARADRGGSQAYEPALIFSLAGDRDRAMRYLRLSCARREPRCLMMNTDQPFNAIRSTPEFVRLSASLPASRPDEGPHAKPAVVSSN